MAIQKAVRILSTILSDGTTTQYTLKLAKDGDPYWVGQAKPGGVGGRIQNWFAEVPTAAAPKGVRVVTGAVSAGLAVPTSILTITIEPKSNGTVQEVVLDLLFT